MHSTSFSTSTKHLPQERVQRHTVDQVIAAPMLDVSVPEMEEKLLLDVFRPHDRQVPELVIEVPKIIIEDIPTRSSVPEPQIAEQLVEVPTILTFLKQIVDNPFPHGGGRRRLQGLFPGQNSTALSVEQTVPRTGFRLILVFSLSSWCAC